MHRQSSLHLSQSSTGRRGPVASCTSLSLSLSCSLSLYICLCLLHSATVCTGVTDGKTAPRKLFKHARERERDARNERVHARCHTLYPCVISQRIPSRCMQSNDILLTSSLSGTPASSASSLSSWMPTGSACAARACSSPSLCVVVVLVTRSRVFPRDSIHSPVEQ